MRRRRTWLNRLTLATVIAHVDEGPSLKGVVAAVHADCLVLREAMTMEEQPSLLKGDIVIPRERVLFMQLVGNGDA